MKNLYLDNAATSFPKAPGVAEAISNYILNVGSNVGRGIYSSSQSAGQIVYETRELLCELFNYDNPMNVVYTKSITESLNTIIKSYLKKGDHVLISSIEHNSVMRPITTLTKYGVELTKVNCDSFGRLDPKKIEESIKPNTKLVLLTHASNVCGTITPIEEVGKICKEHGIHFVIDAAQTAGVIEIDFKKANLSALAFTGHKSLLGPQGIGGFVIDEKFSNELSPFIEGGTGSFSESEEQPNYLPDKFESGTLNIPGIYGLNASLKYIMSKGINSIHQHESYLTEIFLNKIKNIDDIRLLGLDTKEGRTSVVSLDFSSLDNAEVAFTLNDEFGIMTRVGLHCSPSAHKTLGSFPKGSVRFSFGQFLNKDDIDYTVDCVNKTIKLLK